MLNGSMMKNKRTIQILRNLLAGRNGTVTNILELSYQKVLEESLSKKLMQIINEEFEHYEILSKLILSLSAKSYLENGKGIPWSSRYINYTSDPIYFLGNNIKQTERNIQDYEYAINSINDENIKQELTKILENKKEHLETFIKLQRELENSGSQ